MSTLKVNTLQDASGGNNVAMSTLSGINSDGIAKALDKLISLWRSKKLQKTTDKYMMSNLEANIKSPDLKKNKNRLR